MKAMTKKERITEKFNKQINKIVNQQNIENKERKKKKFYKKTAVALRP